MAGDDHPDKKVVAAGESSKDKAALEEGEIIEEEQELDNAPPRPPPVTAVGGSGGGLPPATTMISIEVPPVKKFKMINVGSSGTSVFAPPLAAAPPAPPLQVPCPLCNRIFESYPAMFGHQRVHKDRTYRGAYPPPTFNRDGSPLPTAEKTEEAARHAAQMLIDMSQGLWDKPVTNPPSTGVVEASSSSSRGLGLDLNIPLEPEKEEEEEEDVKVKVKVKVELDLNKSPPESE